MSSFVSLHSGRKSIRIGNPTFKLLLQQMKKKEELVPSLARIAEKNPIAESIGRVNLEELHAEDITAFLELAEQMLLQTETNPLTEAGFNQHEDLANFIEELKEQIKIVE